MPRKDRTPSTISDKKMADLQRRARKADKEPWTGKRATTRRLAQNEQRGKAQWS